MRAANKKVQEFLTRLFAGMAPGTNRKVDTSKVYAALSVERLSESRFSMAHYFEQNGDLVADPDMEFWRDEAGIFYVVAIQQVFGYTRAVEFRDGKPSGFSPSVQIELNGFLNMWVKNLKRQQNL